MQKSKIKRIFKYIIISFLSLLLLLLIFIKCVEYKLNQRVSINKDMQNDSIKKNIQPEAKQLLDSLHNIP